MYTKKQFEEAVKQKKYADQIRLGKQIIATEPDNSAVYIIMGLAGLGDESLLNESAQFAKKAIEMIEAQRAGSELRPCHRGQGRIVPHRAGDRVRGGGEGAERRRPGSGPL